MRQLKFETDDLLKSSLIEILKKILKNKRLSLTLITLFLITRNYGQPAAINGSLSVNGNKIVNKNGQAVSFAGNSLFWSNDLWGGEKYYNTNTINWLRSDWNSAIVRCAMGVETDGGYLKNKTGNKAKVKAVVDAAIANGMYVIIDWHTHNAEYYTDDAISFFKEMAQTYGDKPNIIYEIYNEPINASWSGTIKPYAEKVIDAIRSIDPDNLIIVGTRFYSALVNEPADDPILKKNVAYTIHFYANSHKQDYRDRCQYALNKGIALFATEWGTVNADGDGNVNEGETYAWMDFLNRNHISHCNWSINDKSEGASSLNPGTSSSGNWAESNLTWSGSIVRNILRSYDYGKVTDNVSFTNAPIIVSTKQSYTLNIDYVATKTRDLIVSMSNNQGVVLASSTTQVNGLGTKKLVLNLNKQPVPGNDYNFTCEIRPTGGNQEAVLDKKSILNATLAAQEPIALIEAETYSVMSGVETEACDEGGMNVGYMDDGDWLSYADINIPHSGKYIIYYRVASMSSSGIISLEKDNGKIVLGTVSVPNTGGWQSWTTVSHEAELTEGTYYLGLGIPSGGYNLNLFAIVPKPEITDINPARTNKEFHVYPSPAKDFIQISGTSEHALMLIRNVQGEIVIKETGPEIDVSMLPAGIYFINSENCVNKFIKE